MRVVPAGVGSPASDDAFRHARRPRIERQPRSTSRPEETSCPGRRSVNRHHLLRATHRSRHGEPTWLGPVSRATRPRHRGFGGAGGDHREGSESPGGVGCLPSARGSRFLRPQPPCAAWYWCITSALIRPRSETSMPWLFAHARTSRGPAGTLDFAAARRWVAGLFLTRRAFTR
jgi:hypothetical protein